MKVHLDRDACVGHGRCYVLAPDVFDADEAGHGSVIVEDVPPRLEEIARRAVANCPEQALAIEEE